VSDYVIECGWLTERAAVKSRISYTEQPFVIDFGESRKATEEQSLRKRVLTLETQLRNAETVI
jgi:hypothetical protein